MTFFHSGEDEDRSAVSSGVIARQGELRVRVCQFSLLHRRTRRRRRGGKGKKDEHDKLFDLPMNTASEEPGVLLTELKKRWRHADDRGVLSPFARTASGNFQIGRPVAPKTADPRVTRNPRVLASAASVSIL